MGMLFTIANITGPRRTGGGANGRSPLHHGLRPQLGKRSVALAPGVNVGKPIELSDMCELIKHREQWLLWDTGYPDAVADQPVDTPVGHATRAKKLDVFGDGSTTLLSTPGHTP